jgi:hypothetical protein
LHRATIAHKECGWKGGDGNNNAGVSYRRAIRRDGCWRAVPGRRVLAMDRPRATNKNQQRTGNTTEHLPINVSPISLLFLTVASPDSSGIIAHH